jgi:hypothetical protein
VEGRETTWSRDEKTQAKYEGDALTGVPGGQGTITFPSGSTYVGEFRDWKRHGQGTMTYSKGSKYEGEWKDGEKWNGTYTWPSGTKYVGEWRDGKKNGQGTQYNEEGEFEFGGEMRGDALWSGKSFDSDTGKMIIRKEGEVIEEPPAQEQEVENIEVKQEKESETSDATMSISERLYNFVRLFSLSLMLIVASLVSDSFSCFTSIFSTSCSCAGGSSITSPSLRIIIFPVSLSKLFPLQSASPLISPPNSNSPSSLYCVP